MYELEKREKDSRKHELYLVNIMHGFSIVDSWNMAIWHVECERAKDFVDIAKYQAKIERTKDFVVGDVKEK